MAAPLMGVETESALVLLPNGAQHPAAFHAPDLFMTAARASLKHLPSHDGSGIFLQNGSRLYIDTGCHPELATPECSSPEEATRYVAAAHRILGDLAARLSAELGPRGKALILGSNVDYSGTGSTWGCHESYLHVCDPSLFLEHLVPHLVSRIIYSGGGGFDPFAGGIAFSLSPRTAHLSCVWSRESTSQRGILHGRDESLASEGYHRLHLICGETVRSQKSCYLKLGTTALVVAMIDGGLRPGEGLKLREPVAAMRAFAADPTCTVTAPLSGGRRVSALELQRVHLRLAEANLRKSFMPSWAGTVCAQWRAMLDRLEGAPSAAAKELDWAIKLALFQAHAQRRGVSWDDVRAWRSEPPEERDRRRPGGASIRDLLLLRHQLHVASRAGQDTAALEEALRELASAVEAPPPKPPPPSPERPCKFTSLQQELFELDNRFAQLGPDSLFARLDDSGVLRHRVPEVGDIEPALTQPPQTTRARIRGELVKRYAGKPGQAWTCGWTGVCDQRRRIAFEFADPFTPSSVLEEEPHDLNARPSPRGPILAVD